MDGAGNDYLLGGKTGNCTLIGGVGNDTMGGSEQGNNYLVAGVGNDTLLSYSGNDTLTGGAGSDRFILNPNRLNNSYATITDFRRAQGDKIQVSNRAGNVSIDQNKTYQVHLP